MQPKEAGVNEAYSWPYGVGFSFKPSEKLFFRAFVESANSIPKLLKNVV